MTAAQGFGYKLPTPQEIAETRAEFTAITSGNAIAVTRRWSKQRITTVMGVLNILLYRAAKSEGLLIQVKKAFRTKGYSQSGFHRVSEKAKAIASRGAERFRCGMKTVSLYLKTFWQGSSLGRTCLWQTKKMLSEVFGLFTWEERKFKPGQWGQATVIEDFDFVRALLLYEHLEGLLRRAYGEEKDGFDGLPNHRGAVIVLMFNKVLSGIARYRREDAGETKSEASREKEANQNADRECNQFVRPREFQFIPGEYTVLKDKKPIAGFVLYADGSMKSFKEDRLLQQKYGKFTRRDANPEHQVYEPFPLAELPY